MTSKELQPERLDTLLEALAEFRYHLRSFLQFSEQVAQDHHLRPRQHQLLLQIAGAPEGSVTTINFLADRLGLRQNSLVELADRSEAEGLVRRVEDSADRRRTVLSVTEKGMQVLDALAASHARELDEFGPQLIRALERIKKVRAERRALLPGEHISAVWGAAAAAAEKGGSNAESGEKHVSGAKARFGSAPVMPGLKSRPISEATFSASSGGAPAMAGNKTRRPS